MRQPLISVIIPVFNAEKYLQTSVRSVLEQTYTNIEVLLVNDGSTDRSKEIIAALANQDPRIISLEQKNGRQGKARNLALKHAKGELIALNDADDLWGSDRLEKQMKIMENKEVDFVYGDARILYEDESDFDGSKIKDFSGGLATGLYTGKEMFQLLLDSNRIVTQTVLFKREILVRSGLFEEGLEYQNCEDYELWMRMAYHNVSFLGMSEHLVSYRRHKQSATASFEGQLIPEISVKYKLCREGYISYDTFAGKVKWPVRLLIQSYAVSGNYYKAFLTIVNKNNKLSFLPFRPLHNSFYLATDLLIILFKKLAGRKVLNSLKSVIGRNSKP